MKMKKLAALPLAILATAQTNVYAQGDKMPSMSMTGVVEVELGQATDAAGVSTSDIAVATVELGIDAQINKAVSASIVLLHEEDDTPFGVDAATITYAPENGSWSMTAGQMVLPFARFETNLLSDPLTLDIGEIAESALQFDFGTGSMTASVYLFNGDDKTNKNADDQIDNFGFNLTYAHEGNMNITAGLSYINDMGNIDGIQATTAGAGATDEYVAAIALDLAIDARDFSFIFEHVAASDAFETAELASGAQGAEPTATNIEFAFKMAVAGKPAVFALAQQSTEDAVDLGLPETKTLVGLSIDVKDNTALSFEFSSEEDYAGDSSEAITAQLAVEF